VLLKQRAVVVPELQSIGKLLRRPKPPYIPSKTRDI
jgi:hypothetical protein